MNKQAKIAIFVVFLIALVLLASSVFAAQKKCNDGIDNDGDTYTDYPNDPGCSSAGDNSELGTVQCDNGVNDDNDGLVDYPHDPGCVSVTENNELGTVQCDNNVDDDSDGAKDYPADSLCSSATDNDEADASCSDSDGGFAPSTQGTASGSYNGSPFNSTDSCNSSTILVEYYCSGSRALNNNVNCAGNSTTQCLNGACV